MNTLGKILAVVNLVLSVVVAAFIVNAYVARTNWHAAYNELNNQVKVLIADRDTYVLEAAQLKDALTKANQEAAKSAQVAKAATDDLKARDAECANKLNAENKNVKERDATIASMTSELNRRQQEVNYMKELVAVRDNQLKNMESQVENSRARAVEMELAARSEQQRNNSLLAENERLTKLLQKGGEAAPGTERIAALRRNPPAEDVEGLVKATDAQSGLVTITIGSDAGLNKGNTLEVFRLKPDPAYLGTIEILAVRPNEAVGKPTFRARGAIQVGDRVASNILNRR